MTANSTSLLLVERSTAHRPSRASCLRGHGYPVSTARSVVEALARDVASDIIILDAASMRTSDVRLVSRLPRSLNGTPFILLSPEGSDPSRDGSANALLIEPFTERKLLNRIRHLAPISERRAIEIGTLEFDPERRVVCRGGEQTHLTPKLCRLFRYLLKHSGRLVTRERLMQSVWETNFTGDMRTIDVHISWLR